MWEKVEGVVAEWILGCKKEIRVELQVNYQVPPRKGENDKTDNDPYAKELSTSSTTPGPGTNSGQQKPQCTAIVIL